MCREKRLSFFLSDATQFLFTASIRSTHVWIVAFSQAEGCDTASLLAALRNRRGEGKTNICPLSNRCCLPHTITKVTVDFAAVVVASTRDGVLEKKKKLHCF